MLIVRSTSDNNGVWTLYALRLTSTDVLVLPEDPEQARVEQDMRHPYIFRIIINIVESLLHPETCRTIQRHLSAFNSIGDAFKSSVAKIESIFQTGIHIFRPVVNDHNGYPAQESNLNALNNSASAQYELQVISSR